MSSFLLEGADLAIRDFAAISTDKFEVLTVTYWDFFEGDTLSEVFPDGFQGWALEHAGVMETSLMLHLSSRIRGYVFGAGECPCKFPAVRYVAASSGTHPPWRVSCVSREGICGKRAPVIRSCCQQYRQRPAKSGSKIASARKSFSLAGASFALYWAPSRFSRKEFFSWRASKMKPIVFSKS